MSLRQRSSVSNQESDSDASLITPRPTDVGPTQTPPSASRNAVTQALESSAHLANLLPTGTLLGFQLLTPIFTNGGSCDSATRAMTSILMILLGLSCFLASFTDSVKASDGQVYYGFATFRGLWLFDNQNALDSGMPDLRKYRVSFIDVVHAFLSLLVFAAVALKDKNAVSCLYPAPGGEAQEVLNIAPIGIGVICSLLFVAFPTKRHGIGYPVTRDA